MKKAISIWLAAILLLALAGCGAQTATKSEDAAPAAEETAQEAPAEAAEEDAGIDVDLTKMSSTMVYAEVSNLMYDPDPYIGKTIRMVGLTSSTVDPETGDSYHAVVIRDATACCASGLDYVLAEGEEYPKDGVVAIVTGELELYDAFDTTYCRLKDATLK